MKLILFDIDGTLISSGGAGVRSLNLALEGLFSLQNGFEGIRMAGKTDTQIIREGLTRHGIPADGNVRNVIEVYLKHLRNEMKNDMKRVMPGIHELLEMLRKKEGLGLGLLTGNIEPGARIKLEPFGLNRYFPAGAFGSDDEERNNLLPIAVHRFEKMLRIEIENRDCVIVGDTPRDVECAHIRGAMCIGVATGPYSVEDLREAGADHVFSDLSDPSSFLGLF